MVSPPRAAPVLDKRAAACGGLQIRRTRSHNLQKRKTQGFKVHLPLLRVDALARRRKESHGH